MDSEVIVIIDLKIGNCRSIANMLKKIGFGSVITNQPEEIKKASSLILPGIGSFDTGMARIKEMGLQAILEEKVKAEKCPVLGICLGMQLMTKGSEEGTSSGLGWLDAFTVRFRLEDSSLKVPHMGWNNIKIEKKSLLFNNMEDIECRFYFVHSYHVVCDSDKDILATTHYGYSFVSAFEHENIIGVQFHPEKSHRFGMQLLKNFAEKYQERSC